MVVERNRAATISTPLPLARNPSPDSCGGICGPAHPAARASSASTAPPRTSEVNIVPLPADSPANLDRSRRSEKQDCRDCDATASEGPTKTVARQSVMMQRMKRFDRHLRRQFPSPLRGGVRGGGPSGFRLPSGTPTRHVAAQASLRRDVPPSPQGGGYAAARA